MPKSLQNQALKLYHPNQADMFAILVPTFVPSSRELDEVTMVAKGDWLFVCQPCSVVSLYCLC